MAAVPHPDPPPSSVLAHHISSCGDTLPVLGVAAAELHRQALDSPNASAGFYNRNIRVDVACVAVNVRIPLEHADIMDVTQWPEPRILAAIAAHVAAAPRLYSSCDQPRYQIQEYIHGHQLDAIAPRGTAVPEHVPADVASLFGQLRAIPTDQLPSPADELDDDPRRFANRLWDNTRRLHDSHRPDFTALFRRLGIPEDPFAPLSGAAESLRARPFRLIHCDVHRKNMMIREGRTVFLDWELALYGDPLADVAIHLAKMTYLPHEQQAFLTAWAAAEKEAALPGWPEDLDRYLAGERIKAAVIDAVRYAKVIAAGDRTPAGEQALVDGLTRRLTEAAPLWDRPAPGRDRVEAALCTR